MKKAQKKIYFRMFAYVMLTTIVTFATLLDSVNAEQITSFECFRLICKSFIPSLISLKAYFDTTTQTPNIIKEGTTS